MICDFLTFVICRMLRTEMPVKLFENSLDSSLLFHHEEDATVLTVSMRSPVADERILKRSSRRARINGEWFFATTTTVTLTAVTVVNSTDSPSSVAFPNV